MRQKTILNTRTGISIRSLRWCDNFTSKLRGFMFRRQLAPNEGLVLVEKTPSITGTAIHMLFVFTPLAVFWLDDTGTVRHAALALPWRPYYGAKVPCKYVVELHPSRLLQMHIGDRIQFIDEE